MTNDTHVVWLSSDTPMDLRFHDLPSYEFLIPIGRGLGFTIKEIYRGSFEEAFKRLREIQREGKFYKLVIQ